MATHDDQQYYQQQLAAYYAAQQQQQHGQRPTSSSGVVVHPVSQDTMSVAPKPQPKPLGQSQYLQDMETAVRHGFIRKVYGILTAQLVLTFLVVLGLTFIPGAQLFVASNLWLLYVAIGVSCCTMCGLACSPTLARTTPINYVVLAIFTVCEAFLVAVCTLAYSTTVVLEAFGMCSVIVLGLTLFAFQTKVDFTGMGPYLFVIILVLIVFGIVASFIQDKILNIVYASCGVLVFSLFIVYDTQLMLGGNHSQAFSPDDYVFAALSLYLDIINLFLYLLQLLGQLQK